ncbi:hypothetical protein [Endozoicomonas sp.]|uniref:hypothetical protein n=1 Tax=Endozoicomonas sp. TaxID=1892382 RepID=UPI0028842A9E|nr:hypothetical protein [Endozoicomonas sp.]
MQPVSNQNAVTMMSGLSDSNQNAGVTRDSRGIAKSETSTLYCPKSNVHSSSNGSGSLGWSGKIVTLLAGLSLIKGGGCTTTDSTAIMSGSTSTTGEMMDMQNAMKSLANGAQEAMMMDPDPDVRPCLNKYTFGELAQVLNFENLDCTYNEAEYCPISVPHNYTEKLTLMEQDFCDVLWLTSLYHMGPSGFAEDYSALGIEEFDTNTAPIPPFIQAVFEQFCLGGGEVLVESPKNIDQAAMAEFVNEIGMSVPIYDSSPNGIDLVSKIQYIKNPHTLQTMELFLNEPMLSEDDLIQAFSLDKLDNSDYSLEDAANLIDSGELGRGKRSTTRSMTIIEAGKYYNEATGGGTLMMEDVMGLLTGEPLSEEQIAHLEGICIAEAKSRGVSGGAAAGIAFITALITGTAASVLGYFLGKHKGSSEASLKPAYQSVEM